MNTRRLAAKIITRVVHGGSSLTPVLAEGQNAADSIQDKAFIQAVCFGVCRYYHRLDFILSQLLDKPLKDEEVKALVLVGLFQLRYMRVKPHAAVSETVQAAKKFPWAKALINAVLRTYLRNQEQLEQHADQLKTAAFSHPDWLINQLECDWPAQAAAILGENNHQPPLVLRINQAKTTVDGYLQLLSEQSLLAHPIDFCASAIRLEIPVAVEKLPHFADGWVSIQDTAAQLAAGLLNVKVGQRVLDVCAAPGGKAAHLLECHPDIGELVAVDIDEQRMLRVQDNLRRLHLQASLVVADASQPEDWWDGIGFDRILLDAPCSGTGVIRRHPDIKLHRKKTDIASIVLLQNKLLTAIWPLLKPGGLLLYATCSVLKQENETQIGEFLATHDDAIEVPMVGAGWGITAKYGNQILTGESAMDGFYYARIAKK